MISSCGAGLNWRSDTPTEWTISLLLFVEGELVIFPSILNAILLTKSQSFPSQYVSMFQLLLVPFLKVLNLNHADPLPPNVFGCISIGELKRCSEPGLKLSGAALYAWNGLSAHPVRNMLMSNAVVRASIVLVETIVGFHFYAGISCVFPFGTGFAAIGQVWLGLLLSSRKLQPGRGRKVWMWFC